MALLGRGVRRGEVNEQQQWQIGSLIGGGWRGIGFDHIRLSHQSVSHGGVLQEMR